MQIEEHGCGTSRPAFGSLLWCYVLPGPGQFRRQGAILSCNLIMYLHNTVITAIVVCWVLETTAKAQRLKGSFRV